MSDSDMDKSPVSAKRARESSFNEDDQQEEQQQQIDPKDQVKVIQQLQEQSLQDGETWCLLSKAWYNRWTQYCSRMSSEQASIRAIGEKTPPGPIDNSSILKNGRLAEDLELEKDVFAVPEVAWTELVAWYGSKDESEPIQRLVITNRDGKTVEMYPPQFKLYSIESGSMNQLTRCPVITLSETSPVVDFVNAVKNALDLAADAEIQAWILKDEPEFPNVSVQALGHATLLELDQEDLYISRSGIFHVAVEVKDATSCKFPSDEHQTLKSDSSSVSSASSVFANGFNNLTTSSSTTTPPPPTTTTTTTTTTPSRKHTFGVCGLQNLGNTCFMNSALQCLSNTSQLTKWFLADNYKTDLNRDNPLGMKGQVAEAYGELIKKLWSGTSGSVAPRDFKYTIGRFNSSFSGYQQHDTQELLAFLLDGLHEDLNRIIKKPYIELPDFDGMKDADIAKKSWDYHLARNDSVIVDLFQGQFKSRLICEECKNVSVTFDPFMYLSLPLPIKKKSKTSIVYVPYDPSQQLKRVVVTLSKEASIAHLQKEVAKMMSVDDPNTLLVVEIFSNKIYKVFPQYEPVATITASDIIYVYQLPGPVPPLPKKKARYSYSRYSLPEDDNEEKQPVDENQLIVFPVYCATVTNTTTNKSENSYGNSSNERISQFGEPIILAIPRKDANKFDVLYHLVSSHVERYTQFKLFEEVKDDQQNPFVENNDDDTDLQQYQQQQEDDDDEYYKPNGFNDTIESSDDLPPSYDAIVQEKSDEAENTSFDDMEIDPAVVTPSRNLIHTAAAVTPAGGKKIEPMSNLFAVKVFSGPPSYSRSLEELLPIIQSWTGLVDLRERAQAEQEQLQEYLRQQNESSSDDDEQEKDTEMEDSLVLPARIEDEDEDQQDDQVEDAAALFAKPEDTLADEVDYSNWDDNASARSDNSDRFSTSKQPLSPLIAPALPSPPPAPAPAALPPRQKVSCPPSTIIRQGEGILLEWTPKKAKELFGAARHNNNNESGVCVDAWKDMEDLGDPNDVDMSAQQKKQVTLSDCLDEFTKEEELSEEDLWYCPKCKKHQRATKKFDLWRMPEIMVVHLKRFSHSRTWRDKIDALIDFPTSELDLTDRVLSIHNHASVKDQDRLIYDLYAVDNHYGGLGGGHYTSYAQNFEDGNWYNFDDSHVRKVDVNDVKTTAAYLLFYKRRRPLNDDPVRTVKEIIQEAQEKQQAAELKQQEQKMAQSPPVLNHNNSVQEFSLSDDDNEGNSGDEQQQDAADSIIPENDATTNNDIAQHDQETAEIEDDDDVAAKDSDSAKSNDP